MEILKFKTNLKDQESVSKVAALLDQKENIHLWQVDTNSEDLILSISGKNVDPQKVINAVAQAGYTAEILRIAGIGGADI